MSIELINEAGKEKRIGFLFFVLAPIYLIKYRCFGALFVTPILLLVSTAIPGNGSEGIAVFSFFWIVLFSFPSTLVCVQKMVSSFGFIGKSEKDRDELREYGYYSGAEFLSENERLDYVEEHKEPYDLINTVVNGDYCNQRILYRKNSIWLSRKSGDILLDTNTVEKYEAVGNTSLESAANAAVRGYVGASIGGKLGAGIGLLTAKKTGGNVIAVKFKDGKRSVLKLDNKAFQAFVSQCF